MKHKQKFRRPLALTTTLLPLFAVGTASAEEAKLTFSGQVNAALVFGGDIDNPEIVDNTASGTRFRIRGRSDAFGVRAFMRYEFQAQENSSFGAVDGGESFDTRYAEVGLSAPWGRISLGKGDGAANATAEASYQVSGNLFGGGHLPLFTVAGTLNRDNDANVGWTYYDGFSRVSRLRYDSPSFGGLTGSVSLDSGDRWEAAVRYKNGLGPGTLTLNLGLAESADNENDRTMLSGGYKLNNGFSFAYSYSERTQLAGPDLESQLFSLNYEWKKWIFSIDVGDQGVDGENEVQQIGFQYNESKQLKLYAAYTNFDNADGSTLDAFFVGSRYSF